jgi:hypothetical protein
MADELDPLVRRAFAHVESTLPAEPFVSEVAARIQPARGLGPGGARAYALLSTALGALASGLLLPLRMRRTRLMTLGAAAATVLAAFF